MAAVSLTDPLCKPCSYSPRFKVEVCLRKPLMPIHLSSEQVALEMLCLCSQLDLLIRAQVHQGQLKQDTSPEETECFQKQGAEIIYRMNQCLEHLNEPVLQFEECLDVVGLSTLFPRVEVYMIHGSPVDMLERPPSDAYFPHIGRLNQLLVLSQQLDEDVKHLGSHKYIAHQLSAIYQVLNSLKDILPLSIIRKDIEANFKQLKMSLSTEEGSKLDPQLPAHHVSWVSELTQNVISTVLSLSEELTEDLNPVMEFVSNLS
ncbi:uncharacterized protein LOC107673701 [Sinocyclocheilus anshuiensis]|uniref:uncharacterized protein LOC107673701 n=1 Tax=Sinocyclocheilus anshuiensis TaxID=1608454 RepID=UPI0007B87BB3|nr:PREDICTED: uncharacterized protein LOC107673701 [Sinocyclocheilus anshuiensis]XP_016322915.1 PREDICTED: uncharacterized protein LOC107673701 [Sinocyclocheilus anshuiensis]